MAELNETQMKIKLKSLIREQGKQDYDSRSKDRLKKIVATKIKTTMIGALDYIEKNFGQLWDTDDPLTEEQQYLKDLFLQTRQEILDNGNDQIRNLDTELEQYEVTWKRYTINMPVKQRKDNHG